MKILEILNTEPKPLEYMEMGGMHMGLMSHKDDSFMIQFIKLSDNDMILGNLKDEVKATDNTYFFAFAAEDEFGMPTDERPRDNKFAIGVFNEIISHFKDFCLKKNADKVVFGCRQTDAQLKRVYDRFVKILCKQYGWQVEMETSGEFFGDMKHVWVVKK